MLLDGSHRRMGLLDGLATHSSISQPRMSLGRKRETKGYIIAITLNPDAQEMIRAYLREDF